MARTKYTHRGASCGSPPIIRKKRVLNKKVTTSETSMLETPPASIETPNEPVIIIKEKSLSPPPLKRSILAASEAISKREQEKKRFNEDTSPLSSPIPSEEKKTVVKKKRKLNTKQIVMVPNSTSSRDELTLESPEDNYSKYLNTKGGKNPPIIIDIKKRKIAESSNDETTGPLVKPVPVNNQPVDSLDLSQHSIIPNQSYISHISSKRKLSITSTTTGNSDDTISVKSESSDIFFDALSEFENEDEEMKDL